MLRYQRIAEIAKQMDALQAELASLVSMTPAVEAKSISAKVRQVFARNPERDLTAKDVLALLPSYNGASGTIATLLKRFCDAGEISRSKTGSYRLVKQ